MKSLFIVFALAGSVQSALGAVPVSIDRLSTPICKLVLRFASGTAQRLHSQVPHATDAALDQLIESQIKTLKGSKEKAIRREEALDNILSLPQKTNGYVKDEKVQRSLISNLPDVQMSEAISQKLRGWFRNHADSQAGSELINLLKGPTRFKGKGAFSMANQLLFIVSQKFGLSTELAAYFDGLPLSEQEALLSLIEPADKKIAALSKLQFKETYQKVSAFLPVPPRSNYRYAELTKYVDEDLAINGGLGYYNQMIMASLQLAEFRDPVIKTLAHEPLVKNLYTLVRYRFANGLRVKDLNQSNPQVKLTQPSRDAIVILVNYMVKNPTLWTPSFKSAFLTMARALGTSEGIIAVWFFKNYSFRVAKLLAVGDEMDLGDQLRNSQLATLEVDDHGFSFYGLIDKSR